MKADIVTEKAMALIRRVHSTPIGCKEFSGGWNPERVDGILFNSSASFVIETKITRSDFRADAKKHFRAEGKGVGKYRYYACPEGLITPEELPERWGLIYVRDGRQGATMPVGFGGNVRTGKCEKHPEHGWSVPVFQWYGSTFDGPDYAYDNPAHPKNTFAFDCDPYLEMEYLFALATRYQKGLFTKNLLPHSTCEACCI